MQKDRRLIDDCCRVTDESLLARLLFLQKSVAHFLTNTPQHEHLDSLTYSFIFKFNDSFRNDDWLSPLHKSTLISN